MEVTINPAVELAMAMDDGPSNSGKEDPSCTYSPPVQKRSWRKKTLLILPVAGIILVIWGVLAVPIIVYHLPDDFGTPINGMSNISIQRNTSEIHCRDDFILVLNGTRCNPRCDRFEQIPHYKRVLEDVLNLIGVGICTLSFTALIIVSIIRWKKMLVFPAVFTIFMSACPTIVALIVLISYAGTRGRLYCSSPDLYASIAKSSVFCEIGGALFQYLFLNMTLWWFFHICSLFLKVMFPMRAKLSEHRHKYLYALVLLLGFVLPAVPIVAAFTVAGGYQVSRFPPLFCVARDPPLIYYSLVMPMNVLIAIGVTMLTLIFWVVRRHGNHFKQVPGTSRIRLSTAEKKLLILLCYYIAVVLLSLVAWTIEIRNQYRLSAALVGYFECEATGIQSGVSCNREEFEQYSITELFAIGYILLSSLPAVNLIFAVNFTDLKLKCQKYACFKRETVSSKKINKGVGNSSSSQAGSRPLKGSSVSSK